MTTYTDVPPTTVGPAIGQPIPAAGAPAAGVKTSYSSDCVGGFVELTETTWITYNSPAGSRPMSKGPAQELVCVVTIQVKHTIKTDEKCPRAGQKPGTPPYDAADSKTEFGYGLKAIKEAELKKQQQEQEKEQQKEKVEPKDK